MRKTAFYFWSVLVLFTSAAVSAADGVPDANLRVTVQQKAEGKIIDGFLVFELSCQNGNCSLSSVLLNQCGETAYGKAFYPRLENASTSSGNLKVKNEGNRIIVQEKGSDLAGEFAINLRFDYALPREDRTSVTRLTGFSGGYVRNSSFLKKVFKIDYVPLPQAYQVMNLDCGVLLPGIEKKK